VIDIRHRKSAPKSYPISVGTPQLPVQRTNEAAQNGSKPSTDSSTESLTPSDRTFQSSFNRASPVVIAAG
jgi:hypothetical protein